MGNKSYSISELSREFDISPRSIRFYEERGLLAPCRSAGNQRIYNKRDRARLKLILRGKRFGYNLDEISEIIGFTDTDTDEIGQIRRSLMSGAKKLSEIRERIQDLKLLEQDMLAIEKKLRLRLQELEDAQLPNKAGGGEGALD